MSSVIRPTAELPGRHDVYTNDNVPPLIERDAGTPQCLDYKPAAAGVLGILISGMAAIDERFKIALCLRFPWRAPISLNQKRGIMVPRFSLRALFARRIAVYGHLELLDVFR